MEKIKTKENMSIEKMDRVLQTGSTAIQAYEKFLNRDINIIIGVSAGMVALAGLLWYFAPMFL